MGYTLPETVADLTWDDRPGLEVEVVISPVPMGEFFAFREKVGRLWQSRDLTQWDEWLAISDGWAPRFLRSWSLPEPATAEGMRAQPLELVKAILTGWNRGVAEVPIPLPLASSRPTTAAETHRPSSRRRGSSTTS
jgi:hypothetical protein